MINESVKTIVDADVQQNQQVQQPVACNCQQSRTYSDEEVDDISF